MWDGGYASGSEADGIYRECEMDEDCKMGEMCYDFSSAIDMAMSDLMNEMSEHSQMAASMLTPMMMEMMPKMICLPSKKCLALNVFI